MPVEWRLLFGEIGGTARFRRRFHRPTNLEPEERVSIVFEGFGGVGRVFLNGNRLGEMVDSARAVEFDVTRLLEEMNELAVEIDFDPQDQAGRPGGIWGPVAIEIRPSAF